MTQREMDELGDSYAAQEQQRKSIGRPLPPLPDPPKIVTPEPSDLTDEQRRRIDNLFR